MRNRKEPKSDQSIRDPWDTLKQANIYTKGVPEEAERERKGPERILEEIMAENSPDLIKDTIQ